MIDGRPAGLAGSTARVYLDHAATTPMRPEVLEAMQPYLSERFGNPSGLHHTARTARRALDEAREQLAAVLGCLDDEVVFTSGGTESDNIAIVGSHVGLGGIPVVSAIEHEAVLSPARALKGRVAAVTPAGTLDLDALAELLKGEAASPVSVVSVMAANNETGVVQPVERASSIARELVPGALVHTDAVQAFPWCELSGLAGAADLVSVSAHKLGGPKGVGALVVRRSAKGSLAPVLRGGGQERGMRPGTENVAGAVGLAAAAVATAKEREETVLRVSALRDRLASGLVAARPGVEEVGAGQQRLAGSCLLAFDGVEGEELCYLLDEAGIDASTGSACSSGGREPSHVLIAMGWSRSRARSTVRLSLGRTTGADDVGRLLDTLPRALDRLRA